MKIVEVLRAKPLHCQFILIGATMGKVRMITVDQLSFGGLRAIAYKNIFNSSLCLASRVTKIIVIFDDSVVQA